MAHEWKLLHSLTVWMTSAAAYPTLDSREGQAQPSLGAGQLWERVQRELQGSVESDELQLLLSSQRVSHPAFAPLCALLSTLLPSSPLLLKMLLYRGLPLRLLPSLLLSTSSLPSLCVSLVPSLLASSSAPVQLFGVHLLACLYLPALMVDSAVHQQRAHAVHLLAKRVSQPQQDARARDRDDEEEEKQSPRSAYDASLLHLARDAVVPLLLLAKRAPKHETTLLTLLLVAKGWDAEDEGGAQDAGASMDKPQSGTDEMKDTLAHHSNGVEEVEEEAKQGEDDAAGFDGDAATFASRKRMKSEQNGGDGVMVGAVHMEAESSEWKVGGGV